MSEIEIRYYPVEYKNKFKGFVTARNLLEARMKCKEINEEYYIKGNYLLKPTR